MWVLSNYSSGTQTQRYNRYVCPTIATKLSAPPPPPSAPLSVPPSEIIEFNSSMMIMAADPRTWNTPSHSGSSPFGKSGTSSQFTCPNYPPISLSLFSLRPPRLSGGNFPFLQFTCEWVNLLANRTDTSADTCKHGAGQISPPPQ